MDVKNLNGQLIAYRFKPGAKTIVFIHALGSNQTIWDEVVGKLGGGYGTLTYDIRGHGFSGNSTTQFLIADLADDLVALIDSLDLKNIILCGVSIGGMIAQSIAAKRPDLIDGLILMCTSARIGSIGRWQERINLVEENGVAGIADMVVNTWLSDEFKEKNPDKVALYSTLVSRTPDSGYIDACKALRDDNLTEQTRTISIPTLCVGGTADLSVSAADMKSLADMIEGSDIKMFEGVGHIPSIEIPEKIARLIENFAKRLDNTKNLGMTVRRSVLGDTHVDRAEANKTELEDAFQALITDGAWGTVWASNNISRRERSMLTLALLAALGNFDEIPMHVRATAKTGANERDIKEVFQHVAIYAGVPRANHALKLTRQTLDKMKDQDGDT